MPRLGWGQSPLAVVLRCIASLVVMAAFVPSAARHAPVLGALRETPAAARDAAPRELAAPVLRVLGVTGKDGASVLLVTEGRV